MLAILKLLPEILSLAKTIMGMVIAGVDLFVIKKFMRDMDHALKEAVKTKDTSNLENMFRGN